MHNHNIKIFTKNDVPRLRYIAGIILGDLLGLEWDIVTEMKSFNDQAVINYSSETIPGSFRIEPSSLLFEKGINMVELSVSRWRGLPVFFQTCQGSDLPFDIFAASFYLVSRYEEYLDFRPDSHGRFPASSSLAFKNRFLDRPVVDLWSRELANELVSRYPGLIFSPGNYKAILTIDVDQPFAYLGKNFFRVAGGFMRDMIFNAKKAGERFRVITKSLQDPYNIYDYILQRIIETETDTRFFVSVGNYSEYDKNPSWKSNHYRRLIKMLGNYSTGSHPSYFASDKYPVLKKEFTRLGMILKREITISRFHFIRFKMPESFLMLIKAGISEDYSMGYPEEPGFRAGIARPFIFYNLFQDTPTKLKMIPFQVMDSALYKYRKLDPRVSEELIRRLVNETRNAGGLFVSLWHNTSLQFNVDWDNWRKLFENMLKFQKE